VGWLIEEVSLYVQDEDYKNVINFWGTQVVHPEKILVTPMEGCVL